MGTQRKVKLGYGLVGGAAIISAAASAYILFVMRDGKAPADIIGLLTFPVVIAALPLTAATGDAAIGWRIAASVCLWGWTVIFSVFHLPAAVLMLAAAGLPAGRAPN